MPDVTVRPPQLLCRLFFGYHPANTQVVVGLLLEAVVTEAPRNAPGAAAPRVEDTPRGEMLMPHSEPVADANDLDLPREVHIELQQMVEDAQQEEDRNPAPPSQPTAGSTPFAPGAGRVLRSAQRADPVREIVCWTLRTTSTVHAHTHCTASHGVRRRLPPNTITRIRTEL